MSAIRVPLSEPRLPSAVDTAHVQPQIVFTRQLWERTMPTTDTDDNTGPDRNLSNIGQERNRSRTRKLHSTIPPPLRPPRSSPTHSGTSDTPLTPEESPPFLSSHKRRADVLEQNDLIEDDSVQSRDNSGDSNISLCLCQPEPKVPRPRNAFILYRQHHQAAEVAKHPSATNPNISKIIGDKWWGETENERNRWRTYAEEEKLQHQQRYPQYRYQPKRSRRGSISSETETSYSEPRKCAKCGGRSIIHPSPSTLSARDGQDRAVNSASSSPITTYVQPTIGKNTIHLPPPTPSSTTTPSTRYLPMLDNLSLSSPHPRRMAQGRPPFAPMPRTDESRESPLTPDGKRRRFESPHGTYVMSARAAPSRSNGDPGTPFPFHPQQQSPQQVQQQLSPNNHYTIGPGRRESLPPAAEILLGPPGHTSMPAGIMGPPPRPGVGYSQHRSSQGHGRPAGSDLSLTLPPLQTSSIPPGTAAGRVVQGPVSSNHAPESSRESDKRSLWDKIMSITFQHKIGILRRIMPPLPVTSGRRRAAIIAVEGDDTEAACQLTDWLAEALGRETDMTVKIIDGPRPENVAKDSKLTAEDLLQTVMEWHSKNREILKLVTYEDDARKDSASSVRSKDDDGSSSVREKSSVGSSEVDQSMMDVDNRSNGSSDSSNLVILFRTYTLTASNIFSSGIPIKDVYRPDDHWQWTATLWRGILGPDLTVYVKDTDGWNPARSAEGGIGGVEIVEEPKMKYKFMAVRRNTRSMGGDISRTERSLCDGIKAETLRRLGFEVGEWVRGAITHRS